jgi:hypothetical protein
MPSADFCPAVRPPRGSLSRFEATQSRSPGVSSVAFRARSPDLRFASLMDMDFAISRPLVRCSRLVSGFCPSTRTFALRFLQTPPRDGSPCVLANPSPPSGWVGDLHPRATEHAQHTSKSLRDSPLRASAYPLQQETCTDCGFVTVFGTTELASHRRGDLIGILSLIYSSGNTS